MTLGIGKVEFGVLKRTTMGENRGLKRLWCVIAQGRGWHVTMRSEMRKVRQWARFGDWGARERGCATTKVGCKSCEVSIAGCDDGQKRWIVERVNATWDGGASSSLSAASTGDRGDDVRSPR